MRGVDVNHVPVRLIARPAVELGGGAGTEEIKVIGLRRLIAQRMSEAKRNIPHFAYVEEMDVTELETLHRHLNAKLAPGTLIRVEVIGKLPKAFAGEPKIGDLLP